MQQLRCKRSTWSDSFWVNSKYVASVPGFSGQKRTMFNGMRPESKGECRLLTVKIWNCTWGWDMFSRRAAKMKKLFLFQKLFGRIFAFDTFQLSGWGLMPGIHWPVHDLSLVLDALLVHRIDHCLWHLVHVPHVTARLVRLCDGGSPPLLAISVN